MMSDNNLTTGNDPSGDARLNNLSPPTRHEFRDPTDAQCQSIEDNEAWDGPHEKRRRDLRRQGTEIMADEQLQELRMTIVNKLSLDTASSDDNCGVNNLNRASSDSVTNLKQSYRPNIRPGTLGASISESISEEETKKHIEVIQKGNRNVMLIWDTKRSGNKKVFQQIGDQNVMVDISFLSKACQLQDLQENCIIPIDTNGEVWLEIKRRSQINLPHSVSGGSGQCGSDKPARTPMQHSEDYLHPCTASGPTGADCRCQHCILPSHESVEDNHFEIPPRVPPRLPADRLSRSTEGTGKSSTGLVRTPGEHSDMSTQPETRNSKSSIELADSTYATITVKQDRISMRLTSSENTTRLSAFDEDSSLLGSVLSHKTIVNFLRDEPAAELEVSVVEWAYEDRQLMYENVGGEDVPEMDGPYTLMAPTLPARNYSLSEVDEERPYSTVSPDKGVSPGRPARDKVPLPSDGARDKVPLPSDGARDKVPLPSDGAREKVPLLSDGSKSPTPTECPSIPLPPRRLLQPASGSSNTSIPKQPSPNRNKRKTHLEGYPWYRGSITSQDAKTLLRGQRDGTFLIRDASSTLTSPLECSQREHVYTIEFTDGQQLKRIKIVRTINKFHLNEAEVKMFDSLEDLVHAIVATGMEIQDDTDNRVWKTITVFPYQGCR